MTALCALPATAGLPAFGLDPAAVLGVARVLLAGVAAGAVAVWVVRRRGARRDIAHGTWWEITPPARPGAGAAVAVWQTIGGLLRRQRTGGWWPARIAVEIIGTPGGVRVGVWLPHALRATPLAPALRAAVPAAVLTPAPAPMWPAEGVSVVELRPRGGAWAPALDPAAPTNRTAGGSGAPRSVEGAEAEPLRAVYAALARRSGGELAAVQLVVRAHHSTRIRPGPGVGEGGVSALVARGAGRLLGELARLAGSMLLELLDIFATPTRTAAPRPGAATGAGLGSGAAARDAVAVARVKARDAKRVGGPHLRVTLRVALATPTTVSARSRRRRLAEIVGGFDLVALPLRSRRRRWHPGVLLSARASGSGFLATVGELAALWHLPAEPGWFGLPTQPARDRHPIRDLPRLPTHPTARTVHTHHRQPKDPRPHVDRPAASDGGRR